MRGNLLAAFSLSVATVDGEAVGVDIVLVPTGPKLMLVPLVDGLGVVVEVVKVELS